MAHAKEKLLQEDTERLREEFDTLRRDFRTLARDLKTLATDEQRALGETANDRIVALKAVGERQFDMAKRYAVDAGKAAENTVREHPAYAVAGAAALGFLLGALTLRRR